MSIASDIGSDPIGVGGGPAACGESNAYQSSVMSDDANGGDGNVSQSISMVHQELHCHLLCCVIAGLHLFPVLYCLLCEAELISLSILSSTGCSGRSRAPLGRKSSSIRTPGFTGKIQYQERIFLSHLFSL
ncbi:hypothetical protein PoB_003679000 [Plakobranchus ocellatus]|uniref:Uncharacterized protein n=1 Tax=Plakobranchus ocellatus TaxID=259542 RepID=A0AAV4APU2_9GAST|nr:hypothetical protein PoB_003679000 [Plakobranchus ocellatus]